MPRPVRELRVGEPFQRERRARPPGALAVLVPGALELRLFMPWPRAEIVEAVRTGPVTGALVELPSTLLVAARFGEEGDGLGWTLVRYVHVLAPGGREGVPAFLREPGPVDLRVVVVDSETSLIHALRRVPLPPAAVRRLAAAVWRQVEEPGDPADAEAAIAAAAADPAALDALLGGPRAARIDADGLDLPIFAL